MRRILSQNRITNVSIYRKNFTAEEGAPPAPAKEGGEKKRIYDFCDGQKNYGQNLESEVN